MAGNRCTFRARDPGLRDESARKTHRHLDLSPKPECLKFRR